MIFTHKNNKNKTIPNIEFKIRTLKRGNEKKKHWNEIIYKEGN